MKIVVTIPVAALLISLLSCESMFTTNVFAELDVIDISSLSSEEQAYEIIADSETALEGLSDSEVDGIISDLTDLYNDDSAPDDVQMQAAVAVSEIELAESGADTTIENLGEIASDPGGISDPEDILFDIFVDESGNPLSQAEVEIQISAMLESRTALTQYGLLVASGNPPAGVNADELGFQALVVGMIGVMYDSNGGDAAAVTTISTAIATQSSGGVFDDLPTFDNMTADNGMVTVFGTGLGTAIEGSSLVSAALDAI